MKIKSIIASGLLLLSVGAATTSCQDMFTADNKLVTTDLAPKDTVYQMMGIIKRMQPLIDRTVLLGEVRADLVTITEQATSDLKELAENAVSTTNAYNRPSDYYNVINSCNVYLANVEADRRKAGDSGDKATYYRNEIIAAKCFRAWCYLELAKIYGEVPLVMEPILSSETAEQIVASFNASGSRANLEQITSVLIDDLRDYANLPYNEELRSNYAQKFYNISVNNFFIPVRVMLGELYLWRGSYTGSTADYENAIRMYHDYLTWEGEEKRAGLARAQWFYANMWDNENACQSDIYNYNFSDAIADYDQVVCLLPTDTLEFDGNVTELRSIFCSNFKNNYYPLVTPSEHVKNISKSQVYTYYYTTTDASSQKTWRVEPSPSDPNRFYSSLAQGDLRLSAVYQVGSGGSNKFDGNYNNERQYITKYLAGKKEIKTDQRLNYLTLYRTNIIYLHLAEALCAAGYPETAFVVLKYGLAAKYICNPNTRVISEYEYSRLGKIKMFGSTQRDELNIREDENQGSFLVWRPEKFPVYDKFTNKQQGHTYIGMYQAGIHTVGSGDADVDTMYYYLPTDSAQCMKDMKPLPAPVPGPGVQPLKPTETFPSFEEWYENKYPGDDPEKASSRRKKAYQDEKDQWTSDSTNYSNWLIKKAAYDEYLAAVDSVKRDNRNVFAKNDDVRTKRQTILDLMILEEEALEGMFEGQRFYDVMRWAMRNGQAKSAQSTITMPDYKNLPENSGNLRFVKRDWYSREANPMNGKSWYIPLPQR